MSTRRLYYDDPFQDNFTAQVLSCVPLSDTLAGHEPTSWAVILDQTHFYPTSGGQPNDLGKLGEANVLDVRELESGDILHVIDRPIPTGSAEGCVHWPRRFDHMQQHTGQHLLSAIFQERFGLHTVSFHLGATVSTIDLSGAQPSPQVLEGAARAANAIIFQDREITVRYGTAEQFAGLGVRKQVDRPGILRAIEIAGIDLQPCGGTHVRRTGQIGTILIRDGTKVRQDWRVEFVCGARAEAAARNDFSLLSRLAAELQCGVQDLDASVERILRGREAGSKNLRATLAKLAEAEAALRLKDVLHKEGNAVITDVLEGVPQEYLQLFATAVTRSGSGVALLALKETGALVLAQSPGGVRDMNAILRRVFEQVDGKGGGTRDFARGALSNAANAQVALELAKSLL